MTVGQIFTKYWQLHAVKLSLRKAC